MDNDLVVFADVKENLIVRMDKNLLAGLLVDRSTGKNIIWATSDYADLGQGYQESDEITIEAITGKNGEIIKPRSVKSKEEQSKRVRNMAEVFTPLWICNKQNNLVDDEWFGRKNVFNEEYESSWTPSVGKLQFPDYDQYAPKGWESYIGSKRLEITCGEAPYLVSRYDTVTGDEIPVSKRVGLLDRKFRVINERVRNLKDRTRTKHRWLELALKAVRSTYGFEWSGDNLLLARENVLYTVIEYYRDKFDEEIEVGNLFPFVEAISWNIWQMDGIKCVVPNSCHEYVKEHKAFSPSIFDTRAFSDKTLERSVGFCDVNEDEIMKCQGCLKEDVFLHNGVYCKIKNWSTGKVIFFKDLMNELGSDENVGEKKDFKFDVVIGNPPYQISDGGGVGSSALPVYQYFVADAKNMGPEYIVMITPSRWFAGGRGLDKFRDDMLHDDQLRVINDYLDASECFPGVEIKGGVCYFLWKKGSSGECKINSHLANGKVVETERPLLEKNIDVFLRFSEQISILKKVIEKGEESFSELISANDPFGYDVRVSGSYKRIKPDYKLNYFDGSVDFYYNGWRKNGCGYIDRTTVTKNIDWIDKYKIFIPKAWGVGNPSSDRLNPFIVNPNSVCTETYLVIGPFESESIANNVVSYINTKFFHFMVFMKKITQNTMKSVYTLVPQQDFSKAWTDEELYIKYGFNKEEIAFIDSMIKPM